MSGMAFVGVALNRFAEIARRIDPRFPVRQGLPSSQILASYIGLLAEGKSDFEAIESKRGDAFFQQALGIAGVPSAATLRQRMDALGVPGSEAVDALLVPLLKRGRAQFTATASGHVPLDLDVFCMDNSDSKRKGSAARMPATMVLRRSPSTWARKRATVWRWSCVMAPNTAPRRVSTRWSGRCRAHWR